MGPPNGEVACCVRRAPSSRPSHGPTSGRRWTEYHRACATFPDDASAEQGGEAWRKAQRRKARRIGFGWYYGWNIVGFGLLAQMLSVGLAVNCFSLFLLDWRRDFHAPVSTFQLAMTVFAVVCTPFCAVAGWAVDRFPIRWVIAVGLLIVAAAQVAIGFSNSAWMVVALYIVVGVGVPISAGIPALALVSRWFVKRRGLALGSALSATPRRG